MVIIYYIDIKTVMVFIISVLFNDRVNKRSIMVYIPYRIGAK